MCIVTLGKFLLIGKETQLFNLLVHVPSTVVDHTVSKNLGNGVSNSLAKNAQSVRLRLCLSVRIRF